jgi:hypothetical protein
MARWIILETCRYAVEADSAQAAKLKLTDALDLKFTVPGVELLAVDEREARAPEAGE